MYLVDTSIWIDYFRNRQNISTKFFENILDNKIPFGITSFIYQEILQGALTKRDFRKLEEYLCTQHFYNPNDGIETYKNAAKLYFDARRKGITIRSSIDCLIAQIAIENKLILLHNDQEYILLKKITSQLKTDPD